jgi:hypothetical protein
MIDVKLIYIGETEYNLTKFNLYDAKYDEMEPVYSSTGLYYRVINDLGNEQSYYYALFIEVDKWREMKLKELGI